MQYVTTAPRAYDGFGTIELSPDVGVDNHNQVLRLVSIWHEHLLWQLARYGSGMHSAATLEEAERYPQIYRLR